MAKKITIQVTEAQLRDLAVCVEYTRDQTGDRYTWPGDRTVARAKAGRTVLLRKLRGVMRANKVPEPCHWCGSTSGTFVAEDGYDRCNECQGN